MFCSWESPLANCLAGRSRWRLPQPRDRELQGSTHCGYAFMGLTSCRWITIAGTIAHRRRGAQRAYAGCRVAVERAADPYTLIRAWCVAVA
jgi:hypothetical protein